MGSIPYINFRQIFIAYHPMLQSTGSPLSLLERLLLLIPCITHYCHQLNHGHLNNESYRGIWLLILVSFSLQKIILVNDHTFSTKQNNQFQHFLKLCRKTNPRERTKIIQWAICGVYSIHPCVYVTNHDVLQTEWCNFKFINQKELDVNTRNGNQMKEQLHDSSQRNYIACRTRQKAYDIILLLRKSTFSSQMKLKRGSIWS
jgi:hypothetical protein